MYAHHKYQDGPLAETNGKKSFIASLMLFAALVGSVATAQAAIYRFELDGPSTASDSAGNVIAMTGSGKFDTKTGTVAAVLRSPFKKANELLVWQATHLSYVRYSLSHQCWWRN